MTRVSAAVTLQRLALLAAAFALATWVLGWWTVPLLAAAWGIVRGRDARVPAGALVDQGPAEAALAALVAWAGLLGAAAARGPVDVLAARLAGVMRVPAAALVALTLVFPAVLAWSAAAVGRALAPRRGPRRTA